jgi:release factor glutamine methyltransferase
MADDERMDREFTAAIEQGVLRPARRKNYPMTMGGITFLKSDLLSDIDEEFDVIVANLPYLNPEEKFAPELSFEPSKALFANTRGLALIKKLIRQAPEHLAIDGFLTLEMNCDQIEPIAKYAAANGFAIIQRAPFLLTLQRLSGEIRD